MLGAVSRKYLQNGWFCGIPTGHSKNLLPGERITRDVMAYLCATVRSGGHVRAGRR
jgi:hypothetical protein